MAFEKTFKCVLMVQLLHKALVSELKSFVHSFFLCSRLLFFHRNSKRFVGLSEFIVRVEYKISSSIVKFYILFYFIFFFCAGFC